MVAPPERAASIRLTQTPAATRSRGFFMQRGEVLPNDPAQRSEVPTDGEGRAHGRDLSFSASMSGRQQPYPAPRRHASSHQGSSVASTPASEGAPQVRPGADARLSPSPVRALSG